MNKYEMKVEKIEEQPDGSALVTFDIPHELTKIFIEKGLKAALIDAARKTIMENKSMDIVQQLTLMQDETGIAMAAATEIERLRKKIERFEFLLYGKKEDDSIKSSY
jgi:hypothetical protein